MRRHAPTPPVLPALLLVFFMAALALFAVPAAGPTAVPTATAAGSQVAKAETAAVAPAPPTVHDGVTVHRGSPSPAHLFRLPLTTDPGGDYPHLLRLGATGAATTTGDNLGRRAATFIQGRAPPAAAR